MTKKKSRSVVVDVRLRIDPKLLVEQRIVVDALTCFPEARHDHPRVVARLQGVLSLLDAVQDAVTDAKRPVRYCDLCGEDHKGGESAHKGDRRSR